MIQVSLNAEVLTLTANVSLADVLVQHGFTENYFAVAINRRFIARSQYSTTYLKEGDSIEIVTPMQGG